MSNIFDWQSHVLVQLYVKISFQGICSILQHAVESNQFAKISKNNEHNEQSSE